MSTTGALILAAGLSSRMGRFKPLLPIGKSTFIDHIIQTMRTAGVGPVVIVTGWHAHELEEHFAGRTDITLVHNPDFAHTQMFHSIQRASPPWREPVTGCCFPRRTFPCPAAVPWSC